MKVTYRPKENVDGMELMNRIHALANSAFHFRQIGTRNDGKDYLDESTGCFVQVYADRLTIAEKDEAAIRKSADNLERCGIAFQEAGVE